MNDNNEVILKIDNNIIIFFIIKYSKKPLRYGKNNIIEFQNLLYNFSYEFSLIQNMSIDEFLHCLDSGNQQVILFLNLMKDSKIFKEILIEIEDYYHEILTEIDLYYKKGKEYLEKLLKIKLNNQVIVYVLPTVLGVCFYHNNGIIFLGNIDRSHIIINLFHEILHFYFENDNFSHAIIELITQNELHDFLFGQNKYNWNKFYGHWYLSDIKYKIYKKYKMAIKNNLDLFDLIKYYNEEDNSTIQNNDSYLRLNKRIMHIPGIKNGLIIIDDKIRSTYHIDEDLNNIVNEYCYCNKTFNKKLISENIIKKLSFFLNKGILILTNNEKANLKFDEIKHWKITIDSLVVELNDECNEFCKHCYFRYRDKKHIKNNNIFSFDEYKKLINDLKKFGLRNINLVGGEPLLIGKEQLINYIDYAFNKKYIETITVFTNCTLLDEDFIKKISKYNDKILFTVTIHSSNEVENDKISGFDGDFQNKIISINYFKKYKIRYNVFTILSRHNIGNITEIKKFNDSLKLDIQRKDVYSLARIPLNFKDSLHSNYDSAIENGIGSPFIASRYSLIDFDQILSRRKYNSCFFGHFNINPDGDIYACAEVQDCDTLIGNYYSDFNSNIENMFKKNRYWDVTGNKFLEKIKCKDCEFKFSCHHCINFIRDHKKYFLKDYCTYDPIKGKIIDLDNLIIKGNDNESSKNN